MIESNRYFNRSNFGIHTPIPDVLTHYDQFVETQILEETSRQQPGVLLTLGQKRGKDFFQFILHDPASGYQIGFCNAGLNHAAAFGELEYELLMLISSPYQGIGLSRVLFAYAEEQLVRHNKNKKVSIQSDIQAGPRHRPAVEVLVRRTQMQPHPIYPDQYYKLLADPRNRKPISYVGSETWLLNDIAFYSPAPIQHIVSPDVDIKQGKGETQIVTLHGVPVVKVTREKAKKAHYFRAECLQNTSYEAINSVLSLLDQNGYKADIKRK